MLALVTHNVDAPLNRLLGRRSPIIDIEHLQLFSPNNLSFLLRQACFERVTVQSFQNCYPMWYWLSHRSLAHERQSRRSRRCNWARRPSFFSERRHIEDSS